MIQISLGLGRGGFGGLLLAALQAGVAGGGELLLELLDPPRRIDVLQLARVERVAVVANIDLHLGLGAAGDERFAATARDLGHMYLG